ncbi:hypothetical protein [Haloarcula sp. H-GB5]
MTDWLNYAQYRCPLCQDNCINRADHPAAEANRCKQCYSVPSADLPSIATLYVNGEQIDLSEIGGGGSGSYSPPTQQSQPTTTQRPATSGENRGNSMLILLIAAFTATAAYFSQQ